MHTYTKACAGVLGHFELISLYNVAVHLTGLNSSVYITPFQVFSEHIYIYTGIPPVQPVPYTVCKVDRSIITTLSIHHWETNHSAVRNINFISQLHWKTHLLQKSHQLTAPGVRGCRIAGSLQSPAPARISCMPQSLVRY